jgi:hypothetical protein
MGKAQPPQPLLQLRFPFCSKFYVFYSRKENLISSPFGHILGCVALLGELVIDEAQLAALLAGRDTVQTDEELGAVVGVRVLGVRVVLSELVGGRLLRALEAAGCL